MNFEPHLWIHPVFEILAYAAGYALYRRSLNDQGDIFAEEQRWQMIAAAAIGALIGSRTLGLLDQAPAGHITWSTIILPGGRTAVGGLLGGWTAMVLCRHQPGLFARTCDQFAIPACLGIAIGRIGCFLAGLADGTEGTPTGLPWGINFGDGIARHPTPIYEILFLAALAGLLHRYRQSPYREGTVFRLFMTGYLAWRLLIDFIKPDPLLYGLSVIQWACVVGLLVLLPGLMRFLPNSHRAVRSNE
jgi:phosphatidylglycerol---prolipoprotein diacylglyceryl transferase